MSANHDQEYWHAAALRAKGWDAKDKLAPLRDAFHLPSDVIYLDGNSLGPAPHKAFAEIEHAARQEWGEGLIRSWNNADWFVLCEQYGDLIAALLGAQSGEVIVCDTTSLNIFKAVHAGLSLRPGRKVIVSEAGSFPTDLYVLEGVRATSADLEIKLQGRDADSIEALLDDQVAVVLANQVDYRTGALRDMHALTERIHAAGAVVVWDLCHSAGVVEIDLNAANVDLAVGCTYKYLNGGPGAPAFVYAAKRHLANIKQPLSGWWGHAAPFEFHPSFVADTGIRKFLCGTQHILSMRGLKAGLEMFQGIDMQAVRLKSMAMTDFFIELVEETCHEYGVGLLSPRAGLLRGSQVALTFDHGFAVVQAMIERGVIGDFRTPNIMRFGFSPLFLSFQEVCEAARTLQSVLQTDAWREARFHQVAAVT